MHLRQRDLTTKNGRVGTLSQSESIGLGIRVLADGAWGFASTDRLTREGVAACAAQAVSLAKASALAKRSNVVLVPEQVYVRSEEHTSELQSHSDLVCRLLLAKQKW